jgi:hypothetical protein
MFTWTPSNPLFEGIAKDEGVLVTHGVGDGLNFEIGRREQFTGFSHSEPSHMMHGGAPEGSTAKATQVLSTDVCLMG